jgi:hypothetical protein
MSSRKLSAAVVCVIVLVAVASAAHFSRGPGAWRHAVAAAPHDPYGPMAAEGRPTLNL